jgi:osmotically-inducible protein OsmY
MRLAKVTLTCMLAVTILGFGSARAMQQTTNQKNDRNNTGYLMKEVRHELVTLPWYSVFDNLEYSINGEDVTLMGEVVKPNLRTDAENAVKHIEGVEKVENRIEVLPNSPMDDQIRRAEYRAIYWKSNLSRYGMGTLQSIHIIVNNGRVTLEGVVDSQADKDAAGVYANSVPDVFAVENHLTVNASK